MTRGEGGGDDLHEVPNPGPFVGREEFMASIQGIMEMLRSIAPRGGSSTPVPQELASTPLGETALRALGETTPRGLGEMTGRAKLYPQTITASVPYRK